MYVHTDVYVRTLVCILCVYMSMDTNMYQHVRFVMCVYVHTYACNIVYACISKVR